MGASKILILGRVGSFRIRYMCVGVLGTDLGSLLHVAIFLIFLQIPSTYKSCSVIVTGFTHMIIQNQGWSYRFWNPLSLAYMYGYSLGTAFLLPIIFTHLTTSKAIGIYQGFEKVTISRCFLSLSPRELNALINSTHCKGSLMMSKLKLNIPPPPSNFIHFSQPILRLAIYSVN